MNSSPDASRLWKERHTSDSPQAVPSVFQILRSVRFEISKFLNSLAGETGRRYTRCDMLALKELIAGLLFGAGDSGAFQDVALCIFCV